MSLVSYSCAPEEFVENVWPEMRPSLKGYLRSRATVQERAYLEDMLQDITVKAVKSLGNRRFANVRAFRAWLYTIARNTLYDYRSSLTKEKTTLFEDRTRHAHPLQTRAVQVATLDEDRLADIVEEFVKDALSQLAKRNKESAQVLEYTRTGLSYKKIAEKMGYDPSNKTARSNLRSVASRYRPRFYFLVSAAIEREVHAKNRLTFVEKAVLASLSSELRRLAEKKGGQR